MHVFNYISVAKIINCFCQYASLENPMAQGGHFLSKARVYESKSVRFFLSSVNFPLKTPWDDN